MREEYVQNLDVDNKNQLKLTELILHFSKSVGTICLQFFYHVGSFGLLIWRTFIAFSDFRTYKGHVVDQMMKVGIRSLPLVSYIALFTGMVIALQSVKQFTSTVPLYISGTVVEKAILQELAGVITALVLAGRVGASIAAEIGTMKVTEQIDALESMAFNPISYLVVPRFIAGITMVPILTAFAAAIGLFSGWFTAITLADITTYEFLKGLRLYAELHDFTSPLFKSIAFGGTIILVACYQGLNAKKGAEGVGTAATNAAVVSCLLILTLDFLMSLVLVT